MGPKSLKSKLILIVSALVIGSGVLISLLVTQRYSRSLKEALSAQAENLAHAVALEAADKVLINDLVALQKTLGHHIRSTESLAYLFVLRDGDVVAHTFSRGVPDALIDANRLDQDKEPNLQEIRSTTGDRYLDIAWPIFEGKAGTLRLGYSESIYAQKVRSLWLHMSLLTVGILLFVLAVIKLFLGRITRPLAELASATEKINRGEMGVRVQVAGDGEVAVLADSFNNMVARIEDYTGRLEEQAMELDRSHQQAMTFCGIVREISALGTLEEIWSVLMKKFQELLICNHMCLLVSDTEGGNIFIMWENEAKVLSEPGIIEPVLDRIEGLDGLEFTKRPVLGPPLVPDHFYSAARQAIIPFSPESQLKGALVIACPGECSCNTQEIELVGLILDQSAGAIKRALLHEEEMRDLQGRLSSSSGFMGIVGKDPKMQVIYKLIEDIAPTDATVVIQGESGTGKELIASAIHRLSHRRDEPFVVINCSAYPETLLESELFGHEKGAFTGAVRRKAGRFEQADGGTVFLDEIGEISPSAQIKLLRVLQTQKFERVGGEKTLTVDVRVIAATNRELLGQVKKGRFREDLYYRLNVIPVQLPLLIERSNDIPLLAQHFVRRFAKEQEKAVGAITPKAMELILNHSWPGNVRELENSIEHAVVLAKGNEIRVGDLPPSMRADESHPSASLVDHEKMIIEQTLMECGWNKKEGARRLGISRSTLYSKLKKYGIDEPS